MTLKRHIFGWPRRGINAHVLSGHIAPVSFSVPSRLTQVRAMSRRYTEGKDGAFAEIHAATTVFETSLRENMSPKNPNRGFLMLVSVPVMLLMLSDPGLLCACVAIGFGLRYYNQVPRSQLQDWDTKFLNKFGEYYPLIVIGIPLGLVF